VAKKKLDKSRAAMKMCKETKEAVDEKELAFSCFE